MSVVIPDCGNNCPPTETSEPTNTPVPSNTNTPVPTNTPEDTPTSPPEFTNTPVDPTVTATTYYTPTVTSTLQPGITPTISKEPHEPKQTPTVTALPPTGFFSDVTGDPLMDYKVNMIFAIILLFVIAFLAVRRLRRG